MKGAMKPDDFAPFMHPPGAWAHYAIMSESVENDEQVVKAQTPSPSGQIQGTTIMINRPKDKRTE
jgi:hypothetical protein